MTAVLDNGRDTTFVNPLDLAQLPTARSLVVIAGGGVAFDFAVRSWIVSLGGAAAMTAAAALLIASGTVIRREARLLVGAAPVFGWWLVGRASDELAALNIAAAGGLLITGAMLSRSGSLGDMTLPHWARRLVHAALHTLAVFGYLGRAARLTRPAGHHAAVARAIVRGLVVAFPAVLGLGVLLASADVVFASVFELSVHPVDVVGHVLLIGLGGVGIAALLRLASAVPPRQPRPVPVRLGWIEVAVLLSSIVVLFGAFAIVQLVAALGGAEHVLQSENLTYAEYARSGFFQLLAVAPLTLVLLLTARAVTTDASRTAETALRLLSLGVVLLTLVIVAVATHRLDLYDAAFGLTVLRFYGAAFAVWLGGVFVLFGLVIAGVARERSWFPAAVMALSLATLLVLDVVNPDATVAARNIDRAAAGAELDALYLGQLSDDAVPAMAKRLDRIDPSQRFWVLRAICTDRRSPATGVWRFNAATDAAIEARSEVCPTR